MLLVMVGHERRVGACASNFQPGVLSMLMSMDVSVGPRLAHTVQLKPPSIRKDPSDASAKMQILMEEGQLEGLDVKDGGTSKIPSLLRWCLLGHKLRGLRIRAFTLARENN